MTDLLLRSLGPSAVFLVVLALSRRASASVRHLLAVAGLAATLAVPLFMAVLPSVRLSVLPAPVVPPMRIVAVPTAVPSVAESATVTLAPPPSEPRPFPWVALWISGSLVLALRWTFGLLWLVARLRRAVRIEGLDAPLPIFECDAFRVPVTAWAGRPAVVLPPGWRTWPADRLDLVLRHEVAHVRRGDGLSLLLARLAVAVLWPNPLVWTLARLESRLAERAVDDLVLSGGIPAPQYAEALLDLARSPRANGALPALGMAAKAQVAYRVEMILNPKPPRTLVPRDARRAALSLALLAAVPVAVLGFDAPIQAGPTRPTFSATLATAEAPPAFRLNSKLVRKKDDRSLVYVDSTTEPQIGQSDPARVRTIPSVVVPDGGKIALEVAYDGKRVRVELTPRSDPSNPDRLHINSSLISGRRVTDYNLVDYRVRPGGWVRYALADLRGRGTPYEREVFGEYEILVQLVPLR